MTLLRRSPCRLVSAVLVLFTAGCRTEAPVSEPATASVVFSPRPLRDVSFERTPARRARGEYLVNGVLQCFLCHSERDWSKPGAPPRAGKIGAGAIWWDKPWLVAPNLTPDLETGVGRRTDDMLARAIREGVSHDGRRLHPQMWSHVFRLLSDEDLASVTVYLRSLKPIRNGLPATAIPLDVAKTLTFPEPITEPVPAPDLSTPIARGRYLARLADCVGCHTSWYTPRIPGMFGGGNLIERSNQRIYSSNITSDPSGIPHYDAALFREAMRTGRLKARQLSGVMPWITFRQLKDDDLDAIFSYLQAVRPIRHTIDNINPPTPCAICGGTHPLGEYNRPREATPVPFSLEDVRVFAGAYRFDDGFVMTFEITGGKFMLRLSDAREKPCELITEDRQHFFCRDGIDVVRFVRDAGGRVTHLIDNNVDPAIRVR